MPWNPQDTMSIREEPVALHLPCDSLLQSEPTRDRFPVMFFIVEALVEIPRVVDERDQIYHEPTGCELVRGVAIPAPLILQFLEHILTIGPVSVETWHRFR